MSHNPKFSVSSPPELEDVRHSFGHASLSAPLSAASSEGTREGAKEVAAITGTTDACHHPSAGISGGDFGSLDYLSVRNNASPTSTASPSGLPRHPRGSGGLPSPSGLSPMDRPPSGEFSFDMQNSQSPSYPAESDDGGAGLDPLGGVIDDQHIHKHPPSELASRAHSTTPTHTRGLRIADRYAPRGSDVAFDNSFGSLDAERDLPVSQQAHDSRGVAKGAGGARAHAHGVGQSDATGDMPDAQSPMSPVVGTGPTRTLSHAAAVDLQRVVGIDELTLENWSTHDLNYFVANANLTELFASAYRRRVVDRAWKLGANREISLLRYLTLRRISELGLPAIANIVRCLQRAGIRDVDQIALQRLFCSQMDPQEMTDLKTMLDPRGQFHSLHRLIFNDLGDRQVRTKLLDHIGRIGDKHTKAKGVKVIADIDDTMICSGGSEMFKGTWAGVDRRMPGGSVYPGILSLFREIDLGPQAPSGHWDSSRDSNVVFLSARPHVYGDWTERFSFAMFDRLVGAGAMHAQPTFLSGDLSSLSAVWNNMAPMAMKKVNNFQQYQSLYPEYEYVCFGDNGQADVYVCEMLARKNRETAASRPVSRGLVASFIQQVQPRSLTYRGPHHQYMGQRTEDEWKDNNILFYRTYIGAAVMASRLGLISTEAVHRVALDTLDDLQTAKFANDEQRWAYVTEINTDIHEANTFLRERSCTLPQLQLIPRELYVL